MPSTSAAPASAKPSKRGCERRHPLQHAVCTATRLNDDRGCEGDSKGGARPVRPRKNAKFSSVLPFQRRPTGPSLCLRLRDRCNASRDDVPHHCPIRIRQFEIPTRMAERQLLVIQTQQRQDRRVQIVDLHFVFDGLVAIVIG